MHLKNGIVSEKTSKFYYILGRGCPTSKSNYDWCLLLNLSLFKTSIWLTLLSVVRFSKFEILNRSTQKVTNNYQSVKIFKTVCDRRSRGRVFIPYCLYKRAPDGKRAWLSALQWMKRKEEHSEFYLLIYSLKYENTSVKLSRVDAEWDVGVERPE